MQQQVHLLLSEQEAATFQRSRRLRRVALACGLAAFVVVLCLVVPPIVKHGGALTSFALAGGSVDWHVDKDNWRQGGVTEVEFYNGKTIVTDTALLRLKELHRVEALDLADCTLITEAGL